MKNVSRLLPLLPGMALLTGCNQKVQKDNRQNSPKPNIIYIFADDLGIGDLSCYGATKVSTPHIDRLAGQGVQFTNAYATSATSTPSRFGLLTGMYPWRQENTGIAPGNSELIIDTACVTMADMLKEAGYATGVVGNRIVIKIGYFNINGLTVGITARYGITGKHAIVQRTVTHVNTTAVLFSLSLIHI